MPEAESPQLGKLAVERGLISFEQLSEAIREHERRLAAGSQVPLGEVLIDLELLTRKQLESLLATQGVSERQEQPIHGFELLKKLGEGGMGATYLARQLSMDKLVALKVLRPNLAKDSDFVERFRREARLAGKLDHVNIVRSLDVGQSGRFNFLVMEYVEGKSAYSLMPKGSAMEEELALHIGMQIARALGYAHEHGIVHRDVKPDNILVTEQRIAKLCDFGLARDTGSETRLTQTGMMMGTPNYVSPEQARGEKDVDIRSDIYSLGATLYHMVTGETPFKGTSAAVVMTKHLTEQVPWPQDVNPLVSEHCCRLIVKMMAKDPADRYQTPAELVREMELVIDGKPPESGMLKADLSSVAKKGALPHWPAELDEWEKHLPGRSGTVSAAQKADEQSAGDADKATGPTVQLPAPGRGRGPGAEPSKDRSVSPGEGPAQPADQASAAPSSQGDWVQEFLRSGARAEPEPEPAAPPEEPEDEPAGDRGIVQWGAAFRDRAPQPPLEEEKWFSPTESAVIHQAQGEQEQPAGTGPEGSPGEPRGQTPEAVGRGQEPEVLSAAKEAVPVPGREPAAPPKPGVHPRRPGTRPVRPVGPRKGLPVGLIAGVGALGVAAVVLVVWLLARGGGDGKKPPEDFPPPPGGQGTIPAPAGAPTFRAEWKELKNEGEPPGDYHVGSAQAILYDSKRDRCVMWGGKQGGNGMWSLDSKTGRWACLEKDDPAAPGVDTTRPKPLISDVLYFVYESASDLYRLGSTGEWAYDPTKGQWSKRREAPAGGKFPGWERSGWCYDPDGRRFLALQHACAYYYPSENRIDPLSEGPTVHWVCGGLAYDRRNRQFVLFGGETTAGKPFHNDTWIFDADKKLWRKMNPPVCPPARRYHKLVWHEKLGALVMAGGAGEKGWLNDLWVYETALDRWTEVKPPTAPPPGGAATCYDASQDLLVLFNSGGQTWTCKIERVAGTPPPPPTPAGASPWQGAWKKMGGKPEGSYLFGAAYDTKRNCYLLAGKFFAVWAYSVQTDKWEELSPRVKGDGKTFPELVEDATLAYDASSDGLFYHGSNNSGETQGGILFFDMKTRKWQALTKPGHQPRYSVLAFIGQTPVRYTGGSLDQFDAAQRTWSKMECKMPPSRTERGMGGNSMVHDTQRKRFVLFGGCPDSQGPSLLNDTWVFDLAKKEWTELKPASSPPPRWRHSMCYDSDNDLVVAHGGFDGKRWFTDTWVFDAGCNSWFEITPAAKPPEGTGYIEYDPANKCCIAWNHLMSGEVWTLKIQPAGPAKTPTPTPAGPATFRAEWKELKLAGETPGGRIRIAYHMTYDAKRKRSVLFGGNPTENNVWAKNDLWSLDLAAMCWTCLQKSDSKDPGIDTVRPPGFPGGAHLTYHEGDDLYWVLHQWAYAPNTGTWKKPFRPEWYVYAVPAYDPDGKRFVSSGLASGWAKTCLFVWPSENRTESLPMPHKGGQLAYDRDNKAFILFGSELKGGDTWTWTFDPGSKDWRQRHPPVSPPGRMLFRPVWHDKMRAIVVFGGSRRGDDGGDWLNDLWVYETAADRWTEVKTPTAPPPCWSATCYDASQDMVVLFNEKGQTWTCKIERVEEKK